MKKFHLIILCLVFVLIPAGGSTITVCEEGCNYATIQAAINASENGDFIRVYAGLYRENLEIEKSVNITGTGKDTFLMPLIPFYPAVYINTSSVSIEGLILDSFTGVKIEKKDNVSIINNTFRGNRYGIWTLDSNRIRLTDNTFEGSVIGIFLENTSFAIIHRNQIKNGLLGISMTDSGMNNMTNNNLTSLGLGVFLESSDKNLINKNNFTNCSQGVYSSGSGGNIFSENYAKDIPIFLQNIFSSKNKISSNTLDINTTYAMDKNSYDNLYILKGFNLTGEEFKFSLFEPSISEEYVSFGDGLNLTIVPHILTNKGEAKLEAMLSLNEIGGIDLSTVGFYSLKGNNLSQISKGELMGGEVNSNSSITESGYYILLGKITTVIPALLISADDGNGTGGIGVTSSEPLDNVVMAESYRSNLVANKSVMYIFTSNELSVYEINVIGEEYENDISIRVEALKSTSKIVPNPPPGVVYKNLNIWAGTNRIKEALIRFKVDIDWLSSNYFNNNDIWLVRWDGGRWVQISTTEMTMDSTHIYYESRTDLSAPFAITGLKGVSLPTVTPEATITKPEIAQTVAGAVQPGAPPVSLLYILVILVVIVGMVVLYLKRKL